MLLDRYDSITIGAVQNYLSATLAASQETAVEKAVAITIDENKQTEALYIMIDSPVLYFPTTIVDVLVTSYVQARVENGIIYPPLEAEESDEKEE